MTRRDAPRLQQARQRVARREEAVDLEAAQRAQPLRRRQVSADYLLQAGRPVLEHVGPAHAVGLPGRRAGGGVGAD